jgi:hypothetical protein
MVTKFHIRRVDMNKITTIGHNNPPDPITEALAPFDAVITEAENWTDGEVIETAEQLEVVDGLTKSIKEALKEVGLAEKSAAAPLYDEWKAEKARWKPTLDDLTRIRDALVATCAPFKAKLAAEKKAAERKAWEEANAARLEAERVAREAAASDLEGQRAAQAAKEAALEADKAARAASKDKVKGMRKVHKYEITDHRAALHWIAKNDREAVTSFIETYVSKNHKVSDIDGVNQTIEKEAF